MDVYPMDSILLGTEESVFTTCVINPDLFYVQVESRSKILEDIMNKLETHYTHLRPEEKPLLNKRLGSLCAAKFAVDDKWYRAKITGLGNAITEVQFVDYGNIEYVTEKHIKAIDADLMKYPMQSYRCCLPDVSCPGEFWAYKLIVQFRDTVLDRRCRATFVGENEAKEVYLLQMYDSDGTNINQLLDALNPDRSPVRQASPDIVARPQTAPEVDSEGKPACISHVDTQDRYICQFVAMDIEEDVNDLADNLETVLSDSDHLNEVAAGDDVCAQFDARFRALRQSCTDNGGYLITVVDYDLPCQGVNYFSP